MWMAPVYKSHTICTQWNWWALTLHSLPWSWVFTGTALRKGAVRVADLVPHLQLSLSPPISCLAADGQICPRSSSPEPPPYCIQVVLMSVPFSWKHIETHGSTLVEHPLFVTNIYLNWFNSERQRSRLQWHYKSLHSHHEHKKAQCFNIAHTTMWFKHTF